MEREKPIFMNLMTDFAFKRLFGSRARKQILIKFLNILFAKEGMVVEDVTYHDKEILPDNEDGKRIMYDVYCTTQNDREHIIVEMQQIYHDFFENRTVFYTSKAICDQGRRGEEYDLKPVYSIFIVDFHFSHMARLDMHDVRLMDIHSHEIYSSLFRMLFIHLSGTKNSWDECETEYDKIVFIIKNMHKMNKESKAYLSGEFNEFFRESEIDNLAAEEMVAYSQSRQKYYDNLAAVKFASRDSYNKGIEEGQRKDALKMRQLGLSEEIIKSVTGFTFRDLDESAYVSSPEA